MQNSLHVFALSRTPQTNYITPLVPTTSPQNYEQVVKDGYGLANFQKTTVTNAGQSTGTPNPTTSEIDRFDVDFALSERMTAQRLGRRATAAFGLPVTTAVAGSTGAFKHVFAPLNPQLEGVLPVYTYVEKTDEPADNADITHDRMYPSAGVESISFESGSENAYLTANSSWRGSGKVVKPSGVTFGTGSGNVLLFENAAESSIKSAQAVVSIFPQVNLGGTATTIGCNFRNVRMNYSTGLDASSGYVCPRFQNQSDPNSGSVRGEVSFGNPQIELSFTLVKTRALAQSIDVLGKLESDAQFSMSFVYTGGLIPGITGTPVSYTATFKFTKLTVGSVAYGDENGRDTYEVTTVPLTLGLAYPLSLEIVNNVASYATLS